MYKEAVKERFWSKVNVLSDKKCWKWKGASVHNGYGVFRTGKRLECAHRVAYKIKVGAIPTGLFLDHLCRNRCCVNPSHLEVVTNRENTLRGGGIAALNARKTVCKRGHALSSSFRIASRTHPRRSCETCRAAYDKARRILKKRPSTTNNDST